MDSLRVEIERHVAEAMEVAWETGDWGFEKHDARWSAALADAVGEIHELLVRAAALRRARGEEG